METTYNKLEKQVFSFDFDNTILVKNKEHNGTGESLDDLIADSLRTHFEKNNLSSVLLKKEISAIQEICAQGMAGEINFAESLNGRLAVLKKYGIEITKEIINKYVEKAKSQIDPEMIQLLKNLQAAGHTVVVVSGGFEDWIIPMLEGIVPKENIRCNRIKNPAKPLVVENVIRQTKAELIQTLKEDGTISKDAQITAIGDGMTDFELFEQGIAQKFIGAFYSENRPAVRQKVLEYNQVYFDDFDKFVEYMRKEYLLKIAA